MQNRLQERRFRLDDFYSPKQFAVEPKVSKQCFILNLDIGNETSLSTATLNKATVNCNTNLKQFVNRQIFLKTLENFELLSRLEECV